MVEQNTVSEEVVEAAESVKANANIKGCVVYKFENEEEANLVALLLTEELLANNPFKECGKYDQYQTGFTQFLGEGNSYLLKTSNIVAFQVTEQYKKPKAITVKRKCKVAEANYMKDNNVDKIDKESKDIIKQTVIEGLLPTTDPDEEKTYAVWISGDMIIVGAPTYKKGEDIVATIREVVGSLPVKPLTVCVDVASALTHLLSVGYDEKLMLGSKVELTDEDPANKGVIVFSKESLYNAEVAKHLKEGFLVNKMQMSNDDLIDFTINTDLEMSGLTVNKDVLCGAKDLAALLITINEVGRCVKEVVTVLECSYRG